MAKNNILCVFTLLLFCLFSCRKDTLSITEIDPTNNQEIYLEGDLVGLITNEIGESLEAVQVDVEGVTVISDDKGYFRIKKLIGNSRGSLVKVAKNGYYDGYKFIYTEGLATAFLKIELVTKEETARFQSAVGIQTTIRNGTSISIPSNAIIDDKGNVYNGEVVLFAHWYSPEEMATSKTMPGDLRGIDKNGIMGQLATFGMMAVELETVGGNKLQLGNDQKAELIFPLSSGMITTAPEIIPMWHFNELSGIWEEEGSAELEANGYVGKVSHFSFWNCDDFFQVVGFEGILENELGIEMPNVNVNIFLDGLNLTGSGVTNSQGKFKGQVPRNVPLTLTVENCGEILLEMNIEQLNDYKDFGILTLQRSQFETLVEARLLNCLKMPLVDGYALVKKGTKSELVLADKKGNLSTNVTSCGSSQALFTAYDPMALAVSGTIEIELNGSNRNLGDLTVCEGVQEYVTFSINSGFQNLIQNAEVLLVDNRLVHINAFDQNSNLRFDIQLELLEQGNSIANKIHIVGFNALNEEINLDCNSEQPMCNMEVIFDNKPEVDFYLRGSALGNITTDTSTNVENVRVESNFLLNVDRSINTGRIEGQVWRDVNDNDIRDIDDIPVSGQVITIQRVDGQRMELYSDDVPEIISDNDGQYFVEGLTPGVEYELRFKSSSENRPTDAYVGGDISVDNDFSRNSSSSEYKTAPIVVEDGETISNIDLGLKVGILYVYLHTRGCLPNISLEYEVHGGLAPYMLELSNGEMGIGDFGSFPVDEPGTYEILVRDARGATDIDDLKVADYDGYFEGYIWIDKAGGVRNTRDLNDLPFTNVRVELWDETEMIKFALTGNNGYYILSNLSPGDYRIVVVKPNSYDFVEQGIGPGHLDSDVSPESGMSEFFEIIPCGNRVVIDVGLTEN